MTHSDARTAMDQMYRHQRYFYDLTRKYYLFGRDRLIQELPVGKKDHICEVGCGTARNLVLLGKKHLQVRLYGVDASSEMLKTAAAAVQAAGLGARVKLAT